MNDVVQPMFSLPAFEDVTPDAPVPSYRFNGERHPHFHGGIRAALASPISDVIKILHTPYSHRCELHKAGCIWRSDLRCWVVRPTQGNWTWLLRYMVAQGVVMDVEVKLLMERTSERMQERSAA